MFSRIHASHFLDSRCSSACSARKSAFARCTVDFDIVANHLKIAGKEQSQAESDRPQNSD